MKHDTDDKWIDDKWIDDIRSESTLSARGKDHDRLRKQSMSLK